MFYRPQDGHGLPRDPFNAVVAPRPIGWISTRDGMGRDNLAPYSFFNAVAYVPPQVMFASTSAKEDRDGTKDSVSAIRETGVFCVNLVEYAMREAMNATSRRNGRVRSRRRRQGGMRDDPLFSRGPRAGQPRMQADQDPAASGRGELRDFRRGRGRPSAGRLPRGRAVRRDPLPAALASGLSRLRAGDRTLLDESPG